MSLNRHVVANIASTVVHGTRLNAALHSLHPASVFCVNLTVDESATDIELVEPRTVRYNPAAFINFIDENAEGPMIDLAGWTPAGFAYRVQPLLLDLVEMIWSTVEMSPDASTVPVPDVAGAFATGTLDTDFPDDYSAYLTAVAIRDYTLANTTPDSISMAINTLLNAVALSGHIAAAAYAYTGFAPYVAPYLADKRVSITSDALNNVVVPVVDMRMNIPLGRVFVRG